MSTRSRIGIMLDSFGAKAVKSIYCHWDGYPSNNGRILKEYYNTPEKVKELVELGDLSSLHEKISPEKGMKHTFDNPIENVTVAYHRDRNQKYEYLILNPEKYTRYDGEMDEEYVYLFKSGQWYFRKSHIRKFKLLTEKDIKTE